jgi:hypothetical protein
MPALAVVVALVEIVGCSGSSAGGADGAVTSGVVSCTVSQSSGPGTAVMVCLEGSGTLRGPLELECMGPPDAGSPVTGASNQGHFAQAPCSHDGAVGGCLSTVLGSSQTSWYYAASGITADQVRQLCPGTGATFVAP